MKNTLKPTPFNFIGLLFFGIMGLHVQTAEAKCTDLGGAVVCDTDSPNPDSFNNSVSPDLNLSQLNVYSGSSVTLFTNAGDISNSNNLGAVLNNGTITLFENTITGSINARTSTDANGIYNANNIGTIRNSGTIRGTGPGASLNGKGIANYASIGQIINFNSISSTHSYAIENQGAITGITNNIDGVISGALGGILNSGTIATLNNAQGGTNALQYTGALPTNYNVIISSPTSYGKLVVDGITGSTTFGIYTGSTVRNGTYTAVLSGLTIHHLTRTSGTFNSYSWLLTNSSGDDWDLILSALGPSVTNTNQSLVNTASVLQGTYSLQNAVMANSFTYDCNVFGANNVCLSAGGRNTAVQAANGLNNTSALLIAAYRPHPNYRIGAYADQNLSVSNPGGTVNLGNNAPLIGLFGVWNQHLNGTGAEVKVSAAYGQKNATVTRSAVGSGTTASEAGSGSSTLNSQGAQVTAKYGFAIADNLIVSPYVGVRYTQNNMGGYTEGTSSSVTAPLTYSALNTNATTALAGVGASYKVIPTVTTFTSVGVETDTNTSNGTYTATNASIGALTPVNFNANPVRTRPTAMLGAYYDVAKNQRLGVTGIYRQEAYQAVSTTTVMATYTIGL
jgi:hypothetical protein